MEIIWLRGPASDGASGLRRGEIDTAKRPSFRRRPTLNTQHPPHPEGERWNRRMPPPSWACRARLRALIVWSLLADVRRVSRRSHKMSSCLTDICIMDSAVLSFPTFHVECGRSIRSPCVSAWVCSPASSHRPNHTGLTGETKLARGVCEWCVCVRPRGSADLLSVSSQRPPGSSSAH